VPGVEAAGVPPAEVAVDVGLVRRLLRDQHPDLADLPLQRIGGGWDNEVFRLGAALTVRVPRRPLGADLIGTELQWLPGICPQLPLPTPEPVRAGRPIAQYPYRWAISRYVPGRPVGASPPSGPAAASAADRMAEFLRALHLPAPAAAPRNPYRAVPLADRSDAFEAQLPVLPGHLRGPAAQAWRRAVDVPGHPGPASWVHGDLHGLNVLAVGERLSGVIDFGDLCAGDPATDLACAWLMLDGMGRRRLRLHLDPAEEEWERGRGWGLYLAVMFLAHSAGSQLNARIGRRGLGAVLGVR
jgi:aminoglycoside phosphotransferase (APT) family kinase protein